MPDFLAQLAYIAFALCFSLPAARYSVLALRDARSQPGIVSWLLAALLYLAAWLLFPYYLYQKSLWALGAYFLSLGFFLFLAYKKGRL
jgi:hypothetical protein